MQPNPFLKKLGYSADDRVLIIHADDLGMCQSSLPAFDNLLDFGLVTSGAVMTPGSWFPAVAAYCRQQPQVDMGVHLTLTSEWDTYRWGPVSTRDPQSGLLDQEGYFPRTNEEVWANGDPTAVETEFQAQVEKALQAGIDVTHIDTHMGTVLHPKFMLPYAQLAYRYRLPMLAVRLDEAGWQAMGMDSEMAAMATQFVNQLEESGLPLHEGLFYTTLEQPVGRLEEVLKILNNLPCGLSRLYIHPEIDTPEARAISPDWAGRVADYQTFLNQEVKDLIHNSGIQLTTYRALRDAMRS